MTKGRAVLVEATGGDATAVLQAAIDRTSAEGGGVVRLLAGEHIAGGLCLRSGVELNLAEGAVLRPIPDYDAFAGTTVSVIAEKSDRGMVVARGARDVALTGPGRIAAGGGRFIVGEEAAMGTFVPATYRPRVVVFESCRGVRLENLAVDDSPMWTLHLVDCEDVTVRKVRVSNNRRLPNTDGLVLDACRRALIEDVVISTADDGICLKTSAGPDGEAIGRCEDILVRRAEVASLSCALKVGTESFGDFSNIVFEDCRVVDSNRGLGLFSRDGGRISNVRFSRIDVDCRETPDGFWGSGEGLTVTVLDRRPSRRAGAVEDLVVEDITGRMQGAIALVSASEAGIRNVSLARIHLVQTPGDLGTALRYDMRPTGADLAPAPNAAGRANAWTLGADGRVVGLVDYPGGLPAVFVKGVEGLSTEDVVIGRPEPLPVGWNSADIVRQAR
ncbi:glycoside hydrolase family 28 protein [Pleomorphomonas carboxyditropha]|uniref:Polygalacturonase n=1 Tax=Pleomorphomonas carboxyditropha TaxID=2023338 RepID=A0A2G9WZN6_9HYPH|nr:glycoside hydrolase family 28 protein [Pleomorphomonas carboxyditropha]PIP00176.1 polygalacturonase [Pleomorphomonas carboxyditropha]